MVEVSAILFRVIPFSVTMSGNADAVKKFRQAQQANLKQLNGAMKRKVAFEVEGDDAGIARLSQVLKV